jgi:hypothetical protein
MSDPNPNPDPEAEAWRQEKLRELQELKQRAEALQQRYAELGREQVSSGQLLLRRLLVFGAPVVLIGLGWWLAGGWGIVAAIVLPIVAFFGYALLGPVLRGKMVSIGTLSVDVDAAARRVRFASTAPDAQLALGLLAQLDRWMFRMSVGSRLNAGQTRMLIQVRALAEAQARGGLAEGEWQAEVGAARRELIRFGRDRLGLTYHFISSIGGDHSGDEPEVCLALVRFGLGREDGAQLAQALLSYCAATERKGERSPAALRKAARLLDH